MPPRAPSLQTPIGAPSDGLVRTFGVEALPDCLFPLPLLHPSVPSRSQTQLPLGADSYINVSPLASRSQSV
ncbi:hypothetical protein CGMCC3_g3812 [Colletotrichum fructicola]|nr:uncharacterized protein CGMCC3_g3812 [Colletotrichum fructicola]KAE9580063.1 hypothetical protein CGMCC3_g3812 [Colletotrichum fructicola]